MKLECLENRTLLACVDPQCMGFEKTDSNVDKVEKELIKCDEILNNQNSNPVSIWTRIACHTHATGIHMHINNIF